MNAASETGSTAPTAPENAAVPATRVVLVRHGETEWNRGRRIQGQTDTALSALGVLQAAAIGQRLLRERFAAIYSSDLARARDTARAILQARLQADALTQPEVAPASTQASTQASAQVIVDARLREMDFGEWEGKTSSEIAQSHPEAHARSKARDPDFRIPGGETFRQLYVRAVACVAALAETHPGASICVVAHGGILDMLYRHTNDIALERPRVFSLYNAAFNCLEYHDKRFRLEVWGEVGHLDALSDAVVS